MRIPLYTSILFFVLFQNISNGYVAPSFDDAMICHPIDNAAYQLACTGKQEDQKLFAYARKQYAMHIEHSQITQNCLRIPKIIHQIWLGPHKPPRRCKQWQATWRSLHPDWEYILWTDEKAKELCLIHQDYFDAEPNYGAKSDILRLELLYQFGGLYVDVDCECIQPFDMLHYLCDFYIGFFQVNYLQGSARVNNALLAAHKEHVLIKKCLEELAITRTRFSIDENAIVERTGPSFITAVLKKYIYDSAGITIILPANYFYPWTGMRKGLKLQIQPETMAIHYYTGTWHSKSKKNKTAHNQEKKSALQQLYTKPVKVAS